MRKFALLGCSLFLLSACSNNSINLKTSGASTSATEAPIDFMTFSGHHQRLVGRFDISQPGQARFTWPGSALEFRFEGTAARIAMASTGRIRFQVDVDGVSRDLWVEAGNAVYSLVSDLTPGVHQLRVTRLTESFAIVSAFISDPQVDGALLSQRRAPKKRLLVIGDSITAGYGNEGDSQSCGYSMETSNQQLTYAALAANALRADLHTIAWSGIGAWRSYGEITPVNPTILLRYRRALANDADNQWHVSKYQPDAILINIGTNDYWSGSAGDEYRQGLIALVDRVQADYPNKPVYLIVSAMLGGATRESQQAVLNSLAAGNISVLDLGIIEPADGFGCDYHPNAVTHARMGAALEARLKHDLDW